MSNAESGGMEYISPHGNGSKIKSKTFWLRDLGSEYMVERVKDDWDNCEGEDKSYAEMIRVKGSRDSYRIGKSPLTGLPNRIYFMPSNLYKYSETHLGLYMKDHQKLWPKLAEISGRANEALDTWEEVFIFPIEKFPEVAQIVQFRTKRKISDAQRERLKNMMKTLNANRSKSRGEIHDKNNRSLNTNKRLSEVRNKTIPITLFDAVISHNNDKEEALEMSELRTNDKRGLK